MELSEKFLQAGALLRKQLWNGTFRKVWKVRNCQIPLNYPWPGCNSPCKVFKQVESIPQSFYENTLQPDFGRLFIWTKVPVQNMSKCHTVTAVTAVSHFDIFSLHSWAITLAWQFSALAQCGTLWHWGTLQCGKLWHIVAQCGTEAHSSVANCGTSVWQINSKPANMRSSRPLLFQDFGFGHIWRNMFSSRDWIQMMFSRENDQVAPGPRAPHERRCVVRCPPT